MGRGERRKKAILQVADQGPLESLVIMLRSVGYDCYLPSPTLRGTLRNLGCNMVLSPRDLQRQLGYEMPFPLPDANEGDMNEADLFVDVKAHQSYHTIIHRWPRLEGRVLWYRINGGKPEHVVNAKGDHGDEINPPCAVLTPNQWYGVKEFDGGEPPWVDVDPSMVEGLSSRAYVCWPPFYRFDEYLPRNPPPYARPVCLIHNVSGWGYHHLVGPLRDDLNVRIYGAGCPDGLIQHQLIKIVLSDALCMVHLKSSDAPGYALYEAMAAGCPIICTKRLIWRCRMEELLIPGRTCLAFDRETHDPLDKPEEIKECLEDIHGYLERLKDQGENERIGKNAAGRLFDLMWSERRSSDIDSLRAFMERHFP